jgi:hypothetical protein
MRAVGALAGAIVAMGFGAQTVLGLMVWTLTASPLTATVGVSTSFTLTATNLDLLLDLGCLEVDVPSSFTVSSVSGVVASNGRTWLASATGGTVIIHSQDGGGRLNTGQNVKFVITAVPNTAGLASWPNHSHDRQDCGGTDQTGSALAVTVLPALLPTPTPTPRPTAAPTPTPRPSIAPTAAPTAPTASPSSSSTPQASASMVVAPSPTALPSGSGTPHASAIGSASPSPIADKSPAAGQPGSGAPFPPAPPPAPIAGSQPDVFAGPHLEPVAAQPDTVLGTGGFGTLGGIALWSVPAAVVSVPGVLILLWIGLQALGVLAWIPAVRRLRGEVKSGRTPARA